MKHQARWAGHIVRMSVEFQNNVFLVKFLIKKINKAARKKRFKESLKLFLKTLQKESTFLEKSAIDRNLWRNTLHIAAIHAEEYYILMFK
jgi:hypothetical protein